MKVFAIADLHLSHAYPKPMQKFGEHWTDHFQQISKAWHESVSEQDLVLIPGDISWAMQMKDAEVDLYEIGKLPGQKIIMRGNHDYWWNSLTKVRSALPEKMYALQNEALRFEKIIIAGTRGWSCPGSVYYKKDDDEKIYQREVIRLQLSLSKIPKKQDDVLIVMMHYPPFNERREENEFQAAIREAKADIVVYGHLHGASCKSAFEGTRDGVRYDLVSCDHLNFIPKLITGIDE